MKNFFYYLKETKTLIRLNLMTNIFSILSTGLIFFILTMVVSGWWTSNKVVEAIQGEAEINVYYKDSINNTGIAQLIKTIEGQDGVREARLVDKNEAYDRMVEILGKDTPVLKYLDDNPFSSFIEVKIHLEKMNSVLENLKGMLEIEQVRDNREVLDRLQNLSSVLKVLGYLIVIAVSICTVVIISHIIRLGIYNNREQINTLRLLGAPETFIALPFLMEGLVLTLGGGALALVMTLFSINNIYERMAAPLPFIPLPPLGTLMWNVIILLSLMSIALGIIGSFIGISTAKDRG